MSGLKSKINQICLKSNIFSRQKAQKAQNLPPPRRKAPDTSSGQAGQVSRMGADYHFIF